MNKTRISISNVDMQDVAAKLREELDYVWVSKVVKNPAFDEIIELEIAVDEEPIDFVLLSDVLDRLSVNIIQVASRTSTRQENLEEGDVPQNLVAFWLGATPQ